MADKKIVYVSFAPEDERQRTYLKANALKQAGAFEYLDMPEREVDSAWKVRVRTRIHLSAGVIALMSRDSLTSTAQKFEIATAKEERKRVLGVWAYPDDKGTIDGVKTVVWSWDTIANFIDEL